MKRKRDDNQNQRAPERQSPIKGANSWLLLILWLSTAGIWSLVLFGQSIAAGVQRWALFLVPDQAVAGWFDGPVTAGGMIDRIHLIAVAATVLAVTAAAGHLALRNIALAQQLRRSERMGLIITIGLILHANVLLLIGWAGVLRSPWAPILDLSITLAVAILLGQFFKPRSTNSLQQATGPEEQIAATSHLTHRNSDLLPRALAVMFSTFIVAKAILPPAEYDVREYHLQAPKEWWLAGSIDFMPHNIYANMPMAAEIQSLAAMMIWNLLGLDPSEDVWWWGALSGKVLLASYAVLMATLVAGATRLFAASIGIAEANAVTAARWSRVLALSFPAIVEGASLGLNESAIACNFSAGLLILATAKCSKDEPANPSDFLQITALVALAAGGAMACKYPAVVLVIPILFGLWIIRGVRPLTLKPLLVWLLMLTLGGGVWYLKNWWLAGNPVYPLAAGVFGGQTMTAEKITQWNTGHATPSITIAAFQQSIADLLWNWRLQGWATLPFVVLGIAALARDHQRNLLYSLASAATFGFLVWWLITHRVDRFMIPVLPLAFVVAGIGWAALAENFGRKTPTWGISVLLLFNFIYVAGPALGDSRILVSLDYLRRDDLTASSISRLPAHVRWINKNLTTTDKVLVVGDAAVFDYEPQITYSTTFDQSPLAKLTAPPASDWRANFRTSSVDYLLIHWGEIDRLRSTYGFDERITPKLLQQLTEVGIIIPVDTRESDGNWNLYRIQKNLVDQ